MKGLTKLFWNTENGDHSKRIYEIIPDGFTLDKGFVASSYYRTPKTIFNEIRTLSYNSVLPSWWTPLSRIPVKTKRIDLNGFIQKFIEILSEYIYSIWDPHKTNVVLHSSGWDSRILSSIILNLYKEYGDDWLGEIIFVCFGEESRSFQKIMKAEGWNEDQYISLSKLENKSYLESSLDFSSAWIHLNGPADYPISNCSWAINELRKRDLVPSRFKNTEMWGASYFNEVFDKLMNKNKNLVSKFLDKYYYSRVADFSSALPVPLIQPLLNFESMRYVLQANVDEPIDIRKRIVKQINPDISTIMRVHDVPVQVPTEMGDKLIKQYKESWYGKMNKNKVRVYTNEIKSSPWWSHWTAASFCEYAQGDK